MTKTFTLYLDEGGIPKSYENLSEEKYSRLRELASSQEGVRVLTAGEYDSLRNRGIEGQRASKGKER